MSLMAALTDAIANPSEPYKIFCATAILNITQNESELARNELLNDGSAVLRVA